MEVTDQRAYKELALVLQKQQKLSSNLIIMSLPGMGISRLLREFAKKNLSAKYINTKGQELGQYNLLDLGDEYDEMVVDEYFKQAEDDQKMAVVVSPGQIKDKSSYWQSHIYSTYYFKPFSKEDMAISALIIEPRLTKAELETIYQWGGGISKLTKYLAVNRDKLTKEVEEVATSEEVKLIGGKILDECRRLTEDELGKLGIKSQGGWVSQILEKLSQRVEKGLNLEVDFDLKLKENGEETGEVTADEKKILEAMVQNQGRITKEQVSDIKWGEGKYDKFSDQAINKTMRRLSDKLKYYKIITIPKIGFKLETNGSR